MWEIYDPKQTLLNEPYEQKNAQEEQSNNIADMLNSELYKINGFNIGKIDFWLNQEPSLGNIFEGESGKQIILNQLGYRLNQDNKNNIAYLLKKNPTLIEALVNEEEGFTHEGEKIFLQAVSSGAKAEVQYLLDLAPLLAKTLATNPGRAAFLATFNQRSLATDLDYQKYLLELKWPDTNNPYLEGVFSTMEGHKAFFMIAGHEGIFEPRAQYLLNNYPNELCRVFSSPEADKYFLKQFTIYTTNISNVEDLLSINPDLIDNFSTVKGQKLFLKILDCKYHQEESLDYILRKCSLLKTYFFSQECEKALLKTISQKKINKAKVEYMLKMNPSLKEILLTPEAEKAFIGDFVEKGHYKSNWEYLLKINPGFAKVFSRTEVKKTIFNGFAKGYISQADIIFLLQYNSDLNTIFTSSEAEKVFLDSFCKRTSDYYHHRIDKETLEYLLDKNPSLAKLFLTPQAQKTFLKALANNEYSIDHHQKPVCDWQYLLELSPEFAKAFSSPEGKLVFIRALAEEKININGLKCVFTNNPDLVYSLSAHHFKKAFIKVFTQGKIDYQTLEFLLEKNAALINAFSSSAVKDSFLTNSNEYNLELYNENKENLFEFFKLLLHPSFDLIHSSSSIWNFENAGHDSILKIASDLVMRQQVPPLAKIILDLAAIKLSQLNKSGTIDVTEVRKLFKIAPQLEYIINSAQEDLEEFQYEYPTDPVQQEEDYYSPEDFLANGITEMMHTLNEYENYVQTHFSVSTLENNEEKGGKEEWGDNAHEYFTSNLEITGNLEETLH